MEEITKIELAEKLAEDITRCIVAIYRPRGTQSLELLGTGFTVEYCVQTYLVSAHHVIEHCKDQKLVININSKAACLENILFWISKSCDIAIAHIDDEIASNIGLKNAYCLPLIESCILKDAIDWYFFVGLRSSQRNTLRPFGKYKKMAVRYTNHSFGGKPLEPKSKSTISNLIVFEYSKRSWVDSKGMKLNSSKLNGLSGGPLLQLYGNKESGVACVVIGVFVEYQKAHNELVFSGIDNVISAVKQVHSTRSYEADSE
jgi:hypothetical protein